jgi:hypothetical protein
MLGGAGCRVKTSGPAAFSDGPLRGDRRSLQRRSSGVTYFEYTAAPFGRLRTPPPSRARRGAAANLLSRLAELGGSEWEFGYDGNLQRYALVEDGTPTYYLWDGLRLLETRNADYSLKARFTHGVSAVEGIGSCVEVYRASDSKRFYLLMDHRGSVAAVLDESKSVIASRVYNAFGEIISNSGSWPAEVPFGYQSNWLAPAGLALGASDRPP